ncbi:ABC transporter permease [Spelaeicoccus albus]|uniref:Peptide/nickel transport system permease protein n=1 Tax=Spelaeicoccus albus TaxID=1280376 RepID=A0A7Z0D4M3_9MICO|nr:ABC transporter permease [Spelaeicoccus albus]NYI68770.1 peptide/nickel transport system permease protein [Spelaeicoccus albus]
MTQFISKRIGVGIGLTFLVLTLIFLAIHMVPGDPAAILLSSSGSSAPSPQAIHKMRVLLGLNEPLGVQFWDFLRHTVTGNLGTSYVDGQSVSQAVAERLPRSLELIVFATVIAVFVGVTLGTLAARAGGVIDSVITMLSSIGIALPVFVAGVLLILFFGIQLNWLPAGGYVGWSDPIAHLKLLILPSVTLALPFIANVARMTRSSVLEVQQRDWVRTAAAFGLHPFQVFRKHILRNALNPVVTVVGLQFGKLLGSTVLVEQVFNYPGLSSLLVDGVTHRDYPVVQGIVIVIAVIFITINVIVDLLYGLLDPRVAR